MTALIQFQQGERLAAGRQRRSPGATRSTTARTAPEHRRSPAVLALSCDAGLLRRLEGVAPVVAGVHLARLGDDADPDNLRDRDALLVRPEEGAVAVRATENRGDPREMGRLGPQGIAARLGVSTNVYVFTGDLTVDIVRRASAVHAKYVLPFDQDGAEQWLTRWLAGRR